MKILIVDDEYLAIEIMLRHLSEMGYTNIESTTSSAEALNLCQEHKFDVAFLDINMPVKDGLELAKEIQLLQANISIVFVTAYNEYALDGYEIGVIDYIMKPVTKDRLQISFAHISERFSNIKKKNSKPLKFLAKSNDRISMLGSQDVLYFEAHLSDTIAHTAQESYFLGKRISDLEASLLVNKNFIKVHRSCIINVEKIDYFETIEQGKYCLHFKESKNVIYTSRSGAQNLRQYFEKFI